MPATTMAISHLTHKPRDASPVASRCPVTGKYQFFHTSQRAPSEATTPRTSHCTSHTQQSYSQHQHEHHHHEQEQQHHTVPSWVLRVIDAAAAGETEFRYEAARMIEEGKGPQLMKFMQDLEAQAPPEAARGMSALVARVERWVRDPSRMMVGAAGRRVEASKDVHHSHSSRHYHYPANHHHPHESRRERHRAYSANPRERRNHSPAAGHGHVFSPISHSGSNLVMPTPTLTVTPASSTPTPSTRTPSPIPRSASRGSASDEDLDCISSPGPSTMRGLWVNFDEVNADALVRVGESLGPHTPRPDDEHREAVPQRFSHASRPPSPVSTLYVRTW